MSTQHFQVALMELKVIHFRARLGVSTVYIFIKNIFCTRALWCSYVRSIYKNIQTAFNKSWRAMCECLCVVFCRMHNARIVFHFCFQIIWRMEVFVHNGWMQKWLLYNCITKSIEVAESLIPLEDDARGKYFVTPLLQSLFPFNFTIRSYFLFWSAAKWLSAPVTKLNWYFNVAIFHNHVALFK